MMKWSSWRKVFTQYDQIDEKLGIYSYIYSWIHVFIYESICMNLLINSISPMEYIWSSETGLTESNHACTVQAFV